MHYILDQTIDAADFRHHERRIFGFDAKDHTHFQLHRKSVLRDYFERVEGVDDLARGPFDGLIGGGNYDWSNRQRVDVVAARPDNRLLYSSITFGHDVSFMGAFIQTPIGRVAGHQFDLDFLSRMTIVNLIQSRRRLFSLFFLFALHARAHLGPHLPPDFIRRIFAGVGNNHRDFAGLNFLRRFQNNLEKQRIDVVSAG